MSSTFAPAPVLCLLCFTGNPGGPSPRQRETRGHPAASTAPGHPGWEGSGSPQRSDGVEDTNQGLCSELCAFRVAFLYPYFLECFFCFQTHLGFLHIVLLHILPKCTSSLPLLNNSPLFTLEASEMYRMAQSLEGNFWKNCSERDCSC